MARRGGPAPVGRRSRRHELVSVSEGGAGFSPVDRERGQSPPAGAVVVAPRSPALTPLIAAFSFVAGAPAATPEAALERLLPAGRIHVMVNLSEDEFRTYSGPDGASVRRTRGAVLEGPHSQPRVTDT